MEWAKQLGEFVTIKYNGLEIAGKFGVDGITSGKFPNGEPYTWKKRRRDQSLVDFHYLREQILYLLVTKALDHACYIK